jgi:SAM-dependent methyltransferase
MLGTMTDDSAERRQDRERAFHDAAFTEGGGRGPQGALVEAASKRYLRLVTEACRDGTCLEYGCAMGTTTIEVAGVARRVTGFDVSSVGIDRARQAAKVAGVADRVTFEVQEAEALPYASGSFDVAFGQSVLHHLDLRAAVPEMVRVLRPGGTAIFLEPMGHNPVINLYRKRTPHTRTPDERPLRRSDLRQLEDAFQEARFEFSALLSLASVALPGRAAASIQKGLAKADRLVLSSRSPLRHYAWLCIMTLRTKG